MKRFLRRFLTAKDQREREEKRKVRDQQRKKLQDLINVGGHEAEGEYVAVIKDWMPGISAEELREKIRRFHAAVSERQERDQGFY